MRSRRVPRLLSATARTGLVLVLAAGLLTALAAGGSGRASAAEYTDTTENGVSSWDAATLAAPTGLTASGGCSAVVAGPVVDLSWDSVSGADSYEVLRSDSSGGPYTSIATTSSTSYTDGDVSSGSTYYYVVRSLSGNWESPLSAEASASTPSLCA